MELDVPKQERVLKLKKKWMIWLIVVFSVAASSCNVDADHRRATEAFFEDATRTAKPHQTQTAAAWTSTPRPTATMLPTATTAPTPTTDPSIYDYDDPPRDCVDSNDQPLPCYGNDILSIRFQGERPNIPPAPGAPRADFFPLTWTIIEFDSSPGASDPGYVVCLGLDLDNDITTGLQEGSLRGTEQMNCHGPEMEDIFISQYGENGEFLQDGFLTAYGIAWSADTSYMVGVVLAYNEAPLDVSESVPVMVSICTATPSSCDLVSEIEFAPAENSEPVPLN